MVDRGHRERKVKAVGRRVIVLDGERKDLRLEQAQLGGHRLKFPMALTGVKSSLGQRLQADHLTGSVQRRPQAKDSLPATDFQHALSVEINLAEKLVASPCEIKTVIPQARCLSNTPDAFGGRRGGLRGRDLV